MSDKIKDYQFGENKLDTAMVSARIPKELLDWVRRNKINLTKLLVDSIEKLKKQNEKKD